MEQPVLLTEDASQRPGVVARRDDALKTSVESIEGHADFAYANNEAFPGGTSEDFFIEGMGIKSLNAIVQSTGSFRITLYWQTLGANSILYKKLNAQSGGTKQVISRPMKAPRVRVKVFEESNSDQTLNVTVYGTS